MTVLSDEQVMLRDMAAGWVRDERPLAHARRRFDDPAAAAEDARDTYLAMAAMGWTGVMIDEVHGGSDFGALGMGLLLEQLGRSLVASPLLSSSLAAAFALRGGAASGASDGWLAGIAGGSVIAALAVDEGPHHRPDEVATTAVPTADGWMLSGTKRPVPDAMIADLLLVLARIEGREGRWLFAVPAAADGVTRTTLNQIDASAPGMVALADVRLPSDALLAGGGAALATRTLDAARLGLAAEMLGTAEAAFEITVEYLRTRVQFDRPIGSFQALQHRAAAMFGELQLLRSVVMTGLVALDAAGGRVEDDTVPALASLAKALAGDTLTLVTNEMVQLHGGIGMTHEHDAGLFLKRARVAAMQFGNAAFHRDRWGRMQGF